MAAVSQRSGSAPLAREPCRGGGRLTPPLGANGQRPQRVPRSPPRPPLFRRFAPRAPSRLPRAAPPPPAVPSQVCVLRHPPTRTGRAGVRRALRVTAAGLARGGRTVPLAASRGSRFRSPAPAPSAVGPAAFGAARAGQRGSRRRSVLGGAAWCARRIPPLA